MHDHDHGNDHIKDAQITIHVEPDWENVPIDNRLVDIANTVEGVKAAHSPSTHKMGKSLYADLHVMIDGNLKLRNSYKISRAIKKKISEELPSVKDVTARLEPFEEGKSDDAGEKSMDEEDLIRDILFRHDAVKGVGRILSLKFGNVSKIDIECSFDGKLTIAESHDLLIDIEHSVRKKIKNAIVTIHPIPD